MPAKSTAPNRTATAPSGSVLSQDWQNLTTPLAVAVDIGNSSTIGAANGTHLLIPSALVGANSRTAIPTDQGSALLHYEAGDSVESVGCHWLVGNVAVATAPTSHAKVVDRPDGKLTYALPLVLAQLGLLFPDASEISPAVLVVALPDAKVLAPRMQSVLTGTHLVRVNGRRVTITLNRVDVIEEGRGALLHAVNAGAIDAATVRGATVTVLDLGGGTTLGNAVVRGQFVAESRIVINQGVYALWGAIAADEAPGMMRDRLMNFGDPTAVARSFERGMVGGGIQYLSTGIDLMASYHRHLGQWANNTITPTLNALKQWRDESDVILVTGGGAMLPGLIELLQSQPILGGKIRLCPQPRIANALGMAAFGQSQIGG
ncbi:ParM/StbA family protein [Limnothrix sp. FACHB-1083]|uniref:ParM/StbA family protein n=1 Tax=unclassified Limnothrix TaxID=2632864 RepID=UPI0016812B5B|nr:MULTISPECIES: ParM/StbA family protein [unclassified Limnothrix]MBD2161398.1 ParM/StbA family protein [Limnothrix sp. FACHB-1083]MBD2192090.1 ParM/StbA family protein [Limnothrix sp. FACHB-1088]